MTRMDKWMHEMMKSCERADVVKMREIVSQEYQLRL
jgi:hypothetical protein